MNSRRKFIYDISKGMAFVALAQSGISCKTKEEPAFSDRMLPAPVGGGFEMENYWVWGSSVIKGEDGKYHMFASRWPKDIGFGKWVTNSEIVRAVSDTPVGPYTFQEVVLPIRGKDYFDGLVTHNPRIIKYGDYYLLYYFGTTYDFDIPETNVNIWGDDRARKAWMNKRIGMAYSKSVLGPWRRMDQPVLEPRPGKWDATITSNPAPVVNEKTGEILLIYKSSTNGPEPPLLLGVSKAAGMQGPYLRIKDEPIFNLDTSKTNENDVEDPFVWWAGDHYELIMKDRFGHICGEKGGGIHALSKDGIHWEFAPNPLAYSKTILWDNGKTVYQNHFERPSLLIEDGKPTHLFAATGIGSKEWTFEKTWNMVIPLKS
ncbi:glycoside hydrolase family protein [Aureibaculum luteum]|uniref:glycoside hydrolase family protein n=1 Tax=Aureibaculum luteum TaxID=1548456 RepID=UPI0018E554C5|nr:glycoside hydrolase family protein [Aureibaculum luteum]